MGLGSSSSRVIAVVGLLGALGAMAPLAPAVATRPAPPSAGPLDTEADRAAGERFEERILDHLHYGQIHEQHYRTSERVAGDIATLVGENDSALYTGNYLAAESYRYALAQAKLADLEGAHGNAAREATAAWTAERDDAKARVDAMVRQFHLLINISADWQTELDPHLNDDREPTDDGFVDFGGGVFPGKPGLLFRACTPVDAPAPLNVGRNPDRDRLVGPLRWEDGRDYWCLDATSRDAYAGTTYGLATALDYVAIDDPAMRDTIAHDLMAMTDYTLGYAWTTPRPHGEVVVPEVFGGNDLDNFISPLFVYTPAAQLNMAQVARHAADVAGSDADKRKWEAVWAAELAEEGPQLAGSMEIDNSGPHEAYYKFHLNHLTMVNLVRLEPDPLVRDEFRRAFGVMDATTGDDGNALFEAMTYALTGEESRLDAAVTHHRQWVDYRNRLDASGNITTNSTRCGTDLDCVPGDQVDAVQPLPDGSEQVVTRPGQETELRAALPLDVVDRRAGDFMWQKDPTFLDGNQGPTWEAPGADFLLPYWLIRYTTEAEVPPLAPFPAWPGPRFR